MELSPRDITIAITVYNRRDFVCGAIQSAANQTIPVKVIVVEDSGPDATLRDFISKQFAGRIEYFRNPKNRGLFDNWNACIEYCLTPWLSILHDDDYLAPDFIEAMIALNREAPDCSLYLGRSQLVNERGGAMVNKHGDPIYEGTPMPADLPWRRVNLSDCMWGPPVFFAGQLFRVDDARAVGGFRAGSQFAGDWEMWTRLIARGGAAQSNMRVAFCRSHGGWERGTSKITRNGRLRPLVFIQQKRVLDLIRGQGGEVKFDRNEFLRVAPMSATYLVRHGAALTPRLLQYNVRLLLRTQSPSLQHKLFQIAVRLFGCRFVKLVSLFYRSLAGLKTSEMT